MKKILEQCKGRKIKISIPILPPGYNEGRSFDRCYYVSITRNALAEVLRSVYTDGFDLSDIAVDTGTNHGIVYIDIFKISKL